MGEICIRVRWAATGADRLSRYGASNMAIASLVNIKIVHKDGKFGVELRIRMIDSGRNKHQVSRPYCMICILGTKCGGEDSVQGVGMMAPARCQVSMEALFLLFHMQS